MFREEKKRDALPLHMQSGSIPKAQGQGEREREGRGEEQGEVAARKREVKVRREMQRDQQEGKEQQL